MPINIGPLEIAIVLGIALIVFGPKRLPELGSSMGRGIREFTKSIAGDSEKRAALPEGGLAEGTTPAAPGRAEAGAGDPTR